MTYFGLFRDAGGLEERDRKYRNQEFQHDLLIAGVYN